MIFKYLLFLELKELSKLFYLGIRVFVSFVVIPYIWRLEM
jgi:hypothetical protein